MKTATCSTEDDAEHFDARRAMGRARWPTAIHCCVIETTEVTYRRFGDVDATFAYEEGEGDRSLDYWR